MPAMPIFSSETRLVPLNVTVTDKAATWSPICRRARFRCSKTASPQQIKIFKREDVPVSLGLIIDNSGSMREKRQGVESAALALVRDSNPQDEVFIVNFNDEAYLDADFTSDIKDDGTGSRPRSIRAAARPCAMPSACRSIT